MTKHWTALPNFVDCAVFRPAVNADEKRAIREAMGLPADALVVGCVAAVKKHHKRIDYLIREVAKLVFQSEEASREGAKARSEEIHHPAGGGLPTLPFVASRLRVKYSFPYLLIAGAKTGDTAELLALAESLIPGRYKIHTDCTRGQMPDLYRAMDVFVLASLFEMMPIALLEALASGLPCLVNQHPVLEWMIGAEGEKKELLSCQVAELFGKSPSGHSLTTEQLNNPTTLSPPPTTQQLNNATTSSVGGMAVDMSKEGALAATLSGLSPEWLVQHGCQARDRAVKMFSKEAVISQYVEYYREVMGEG